MKYVFILCILFTGCSKQSSEKNAHHSDSTGNQINNEFDKVFIAADSGKPWAILELYKILEEGDYVETAEVAEIELTELLYKKTNNWIEAFSQLPDSSKSIFIKRYHWAYIGEVDFPDDSTMTQEHYRKVVLENLKNIHGNFRERKLAQDLIKVFQAVIVGDSI